MKRNFFYPITPMANQIGTMVEDLLNNGLNDFFGGQAFQSTVPAVNVSENENSFIVEVAAPGLKKEDFKVSVEKGYLNISTSQEKETEETKENYTRKEFSYSKFSRAFKLPEHADAAKISGSYNNGVLKLTIEKKVAIKDEKTIEIQ
ncbi:MAG: Hsp20/alpha crystallin family protein [Saprospiraceae bacterium]|nr:Hsp20/alpha crystallin family protein [Candidatus Vicinibacter affinis]HQX45448.1 Hsp20/alpha crystallin family protein [Saprospiraceae bacterium]MBK6572955.1 Hsp20/alpha crystallin family protein [Candidatus Vicinibacter affinis]MBK6822569.1 Hsp20/alpha crystallin family protein [Candidatus Vicinibacter affinis]MBK7301645.1 Hsp20/alpha crystallin family protein [Candidatus Vicinibacter affinis]